MITVEEALEHLFALVSPVSTESVALRAAAGRVLSDPVVAQRAQPPFPSSAMDGYAVADSSPTAGSKYMVVGEAAAGAAWSGELRGRQAVRIFTGAPVPAGGTTILIQEDVDRQDDTIVVKPGVVEFGHYIRSAGGDFSKGHVLKSPLRLRPVDLALAAAMNAPEVSVFRRPIVAIVSTGDELVQPGQDPRPDQIVASNALALAAMVESEGAEARVLPIARDTEDGLRQAFELARGADLIVTIGGASVGDHDLVAPVAAELGMEQSFYKVAMRPGKPLMAGKLGASVMIGLPGNPVSSIVCGIVFVLPMLRAMQGLPACPAPRRTVPLATDVGKNGQREHYMRAVLTDQGVTPAERQDSSLLNVLSGADALLIRPANDPARPIGAEVEIVPL